MADVGERVAAEEHQVGEFPRPDRAEPVVEAEAPRRVQGRRPQRVGGRQPRRHQVLQLLVQCRPGDDERGRRVGAGEQPNSRPVHPPDQLHVAPAQRLPVAQVGGRQPDPHPRQLDDAVRDLALPVQADE